MDQNIDPTIKALASTIGEIETGAATPDAYTKKGASGEYGRYQFMPKTYENYAKKYVGDAKAPPTMENQNKIVYSFIKEKKDAGYNPAQIMSMWNAGEGRPDAYKQNWKGVNSQGVSYDTPSYVQRGSKLYQQKKAQMMGGMAAPLASQENSFGKDVGDTVKKAGDKLSGAIGDTLSGKINPLSGVIQSAGAVAGGLTGVVGNALEHTPVIGGVVKGAEKLIGQGAQALAQTQPGQAAVQGYGRFAEAHPELSADIGAGVDIASAVPVLKGLGAVKGAVSGSVKKGLYGATDAGYEMVAPRLVGKKAEQALMQRGTVQKGLLRETQIAPDPKYQDIEKTFFEGVPGASTGKSFTYNISQGQKAVDSMKKSLKADAAIEGAGKIYPAKELTARLKRIEKPDLIVADNTLNNVYDRLINRVEGIAKEKGGKIENLPEILSDFDAMVKKQYPNLYKSEALTPLRSAVKSIREEIKTFAEESMPSLALKERMLNIHKILTAMESMAGKATKGATSEIGKNILSDKFGKTKALMRLTGKYAAEGAGLGGVLHLLGE